LQLAPICTACKQPGHKRGQCLLDKNTEEDNLTSKSYGSLSESSDEDDPCESHADFEGATSTQQPYSAIQSEEREADAQQATNSQQPNAACQPMEREAASRRKMKHKSVKKRKQVSAMAAEDTKITAFLTAVRQRDTGDDNLANLEAELKSQVGKPVRSPKTPPEEQNDNSKRSKQQQQGR